MFLVGFATCTPPQIHDLTEVCAFAVASPLLVHRKTGGSQGAQEITDVSAREGWEL